LKLLEAAAAQGHEPAVNSLATLQQADTETSD